jgi:MSHA pilin protein MshC
MDCGAFPKNRHNQDFSMGRFFRHNRDSGFTMIEVIAVLVILGVIAAVAVSKVSSISAYNVFSEAEILKTNLRFAQIKAMGDVSPWGINIGSSAYTLTPSGTNLPGESSSTHTFPGGVTATPQTITFDTWGSPGAGTLIITLTRGTDTATITVTKNTGFIP